MRRDEFLERVREAAHAGRAFRIHALEQADNAGYIGGGADLCVTLAAEVEAVGGQAQVLSDPHDACRELERLLDEYQVQQALCWQHSLLERLGTRPILDAKGIRYANHETLARLPEMERRQQILAAEAGISSVDYAVAETGSLVVCSQPGQERVMSLLPPVHIALVGESQIVPDLFDVFAALKQTGVEQLPSNLAFITGPSKTGDIELQLTTGVHGPGKWHVLILRDW